MQLSGLDPRAGKHHYGKTVEIHLTSVVELLISCRCCFPDFDCVPQLCKMLTLESAQSR